MSVRILVLEDEPQIRSMLCQSLQSEAWQTHGAANLAQAHEALTAAEFQMAVVDLGLPDGSGQEFIQALRAWNTMPVLVLSARSQERDKIDALDAGADDYLTKPFARGEFLARVRALLRRGGAVAQPVVEFGEVRVDFIHRQVWRQSQEVHLTPIEFRLLSAMIAGQGKVLTHRHLLREVWGSAYMESPHYLRIYVGHLRQKLEADSARPRHLVTETGTGYRFVP